MRHDSLSTRSSSIRLSVKVSLIGLACVAVVTVAALMARSSLLRTAEASSPATSNITVPSTVGQTVSVTWTGTIPPGSSPTNNCVALVDTAGVDQHTSTVTVPAGLYNTIGAQFTFRINWTPVVNINSSDEILSVIGPGGVVVGSSDGGSPVETVGAINLASGSYKIVACGFANAQPQPYTGTLEITTVPPPPTYGTGAMGFGPSIIVDFQRTEGEPLLHIDKDGKYWESGPWGFSTNMSFMHRSVDGGDQFNVVSPTAIRPNGPPGGGDTTHAIDDQGVVYFGDLEGALTELDCSVSNDQGNTWKKNPACVPFTGTDRQWLVVDNGSNHTVGPAGAADNTVFYAFHDVALGHLIFSSPGSTGQTDLTGGLVFTAASTNTTTGLFYSGGGNCGEIVFDPVSRNLYYPCAAGDHIEVIVGHVNPGQRTGLTFTTKVLEDSPGGQVSNLFPPLSVDSAGNVYVVWSDPGDHNLYYKYSTDQGNTWSPTVRLNAPPANSNVFAWAEAGSAGNLVAVWLGNDSTTLSDNMPNWQTDPVAAAAFPFYGYVALVTNANTPSPNINQNRFSSKPVHYGQICNSGIGCTAQVPQGDRIMADFLSVDIAADGAVQVMYNDTTSQFHGAHLLMARQLTGQTPLGTSLNKTTPSSPTFDPTGDAQVPHYGPTGAGANQPQLDFKSVAVNQIDANTVRVRMTMDSLSSMLPPPGKTSAFWITRFQALSKNDAGTGEAYRIFYVGAESVGGAAPVFFAGSPNLTGPHVGCNGTTPGTCKVVQYPMEFTSLTGPLAGSVSGNTVCIDMPLSMFGANRPIGNTLYNVAAFSGGRNNPAEDIYAEGDSTPSFDFTLGTISATPCAAPTIATRSNVALGSSGSTATASSSHSSGVYSVSSTIDGESIGNNWGNNGGWNDGTRGAYPDWVEIAFPAAQTIDEINVITLQNNWQNAVSRPDETTSASAEGILDFDVQYWNGQQWVTIPGGNVSGNDKALRRFLFTAITTTKIRVVVNNSRNNWSRIVEVEAFGVPGP